MHTRVTTRGWLTAVAAALIGCGSAASGGASAETAAVAGEGASGSERRSRVEESAPAVARTPPPAPPPTTPAAAPPAPPPPAAPAVTPPRYTEVQAFLMQSGRGQRCFQNSIITADLSEVWVDGDFDGDGAPERVFQTPDCLVAAVLRGPRWEISVTAPRPVGRDVESVRLRAVAGPGGRPIIEAVDLQGTQRSTSRWRFTGTAIESL